ncbi:MAG TPA: hypothetical protein VJS45_04110 [Acidimicrobiia bacterium]|nr:hypothetical protein [Acidimicrobiia bacterium]
MTGTARLRRVALAVAVVGLLVGAPTGVSRAADVDQPRIRSSITLSPTGLLASRPGEPLDTRLQRDTATDKGQRSTRQDSSTGPAASGRRAQQWVAALAAVLERAGHPERVGQILLRGPPGSSV